MHNDDLEGGRRCSQTAKQLIGGFNDTPMTVYLNLIIEWDRDVIESRRGPPEQTPVDRTKRSEC